MCVDKCSLIMKVWHHTKLLYRILIFKKRVCKYRSPLPSTQQNETKRSAFTAFGKVYLVKKQGGRDDGVLYAMKLINTNKFMALNDGSRTWCACQMLRRTFPGRTELRVQDFNKILPRTWWVHQNYSNCTTSEKQSKQHDREGLWVQWERTVTGIRPVHRNCQCSH
jgi:hypothetical protein